MIVKILGGKLGTPIGEKIGLFVGVSVSDFVIQYQKFQ